MSYEFTGVFIPASILLNKSLSSLCKLVWCEISALSQERPCRAGNAHFADHFGVSEKTIQRAIAKLKSENLIQIFEGNSLLREMFAVQPQSVALQKKRKESRVTKSNPDKNVQVNPDKNVHRNQKVSPSLKEEGSKEEIDPFSLLENDPFFKDQEVIPASTKDNRKAKLDNITEDQTERLLYTTFENPKIIDKLRTRFHWKTLHYIAADIKRRLSTQDILKPINYLLKCIVQKLLNYKAFMSKINSANKQKGYLYA